MNQFVVTAILRDFSSSNNNNKCEISSDKRFSSPLPFLFYANGNCEDNEGYVSIIFSSPQSPYLNSYEFFTYDEIRFHVSVVDVAGSKRFPQSIVLFPHQVEWTVKEEDQVKYPDELSNFGLERYLKRETLLNDPDELLADDCLTICVDVDRYIHFDSRVWIPISFPSAVCSEEKEAYIQLDTDVGRELCRVSEFFRCASDVPMMESRTRKVRILLEEAMPFRIVFDVLKGSEAFAVSTRHICDLYRLADKYDIQSVIETCRQFVKAVFSATDDTILREKAAKSVPEFLKLAEDYRDDDLKETLQTYLESKEHFGTNYDDLGQHLKEKLHTEWKCELKDLSRYSSHWSFAKKRSIIDREFYQ